MLIKNTEPMTFVRLVYHNTKPLTVNRLAATFRFGGLLIAVVIAWCGCVVTGLSVLWFPAYLVLVMLALLALDTTIGLCNTLLELRVLDTMEVGDGKRSTASAEEDEQGEGDEGEGSPVA